MSEEKWLDVEQQRAWIGLVATMVLLDTALDRDLRADSGITHSQYGIMSQLSTAPGRTMHMSELAGLTSSSPSRLSHAVATLEAAGWVTRSRCPQSWRAVHATLTDAGFDLVVAAAPGHVAAVRRMVFDRLSPEQVQQLQEITRLALQGIAAEGIATPPWAVSSDQG